MPVPTQQNWNNREEVVTANELIAFFKESKNPWSGKAFPVTIVKNSSVKFIVKKANTKVNKVSDKSVRQDVDYIDTETRTVVIENMYTSGQHILEVDLLADNGQDLESTAQYEVSNNLSEQIAKDDTLAVKTYAEVVEISADEPVAHLQAMLKGYDILFQRGNEANCKFYITNSQYDKLVYLANNKGLIGDNNLAQQLRLDGTKLFIKGIECTIVQDAYMTDGEEKMPWVLYTPRALKRYYLENASVYVEAVKDGKTPRMVLIGGEVTSDAFPYMLESETFSRWLLKGKFPGRKQISDIIKELDLKGTDNSVPVPTNDDIPAAGQVANAVIAKNPDATINDFLVDQNSIKITKKPVDGATDKDYQYGEATAELSGVGGYEGKLNITFTYGRLIPSSTNSKSSTTVTESKLKLYQKLLEANAKITNLQNQIQEKEAAAKETEETNTDQPGEASTTVTEETNTDQPGEASDTVTEETEATEAN